MEVEVQPSTKDFTFWHAYLSDHPRPNYSIGKWPRRSSYSGTSYIVRYSGLRYISQAPPFHVIPEGDCASGVTGSALQHRLEKIDIVLGAPHLGRNGDEAQDIVGLFLEYLAIRIRYPPLMVTATPVKDFLRTVQESSQDALAHAIPWHLLLESLNITPELPDPPLFDVVVSYHDDFGRIAMPGIEAKPVYAWTEGAKFKLMVEFVVATDASLLMRLEYSDECFDTRSIAILGRSIVTALDLIVDGISHEVIKRRLSATQDEDGDAVCPESWSKSDTQVTRHPPHAPPLFEAIAKPI
ncbi:hypothetical protein DL768_006766 [Monosporascus sp. mg162]|nr:hypothetical protein DL768_006766 [Monosporascus sp. mg162]